MGVIPAKAGIHRQHEAWIPAFAGMTMRFFLAMRQYEVLHFCREKRGDIFRAFIPALGWS